MLNEQEKEKMRLAMDTSDMVQSRVTDIHSSLAEMMEAMMSLPSDDHENAEEIYLALDGLLKTVTVVSTYAAQHSQSAKRMREYQKVMKVFFSNELGMTLDRPG